MNAFEKWYETLEHCPSPRECFIEGLRRAAEIASEHNCPNAWNKIEAEAARIDTENRPG